MKFIKLAFYGIIALFFAIQFVPSNLPEVNDDTSGDLIVMENAPENVSSILHKACYDCHSNQTHYPWYSYVAPIAWLVADDTRMGREELNFSEWSTLSKRRKIKVLKEMAEETEKKKMPLPVYTIVHKDAILSDEEIALISEWTASVSSDILGGK